MTVPAVDIRLYAALRAYAADRPSVRAEIEPGQTVEEVLRALGVPVEQARVIFVNCRATIRSICFTGTRAWPTRGRRPRSGVRPPRRC